MTGFEVRYNGVDDFMTSGSIDSYARCLDNGGALAYTRGDGSLTYVLGQGVSGGTSTIEATGAQLNMPDVDTATLTVTVNRVENTVETPTEVSVEAYLEVEVSGELRDADGNVIYDGPMLRLIEGHVKVTCKPSVMPSSSSTDPTASTSIPSDSPNPQSDSEKPTDSESPSTTSESPTTESPSPTSESPTTASPSPTSASPTTELPSSPTTEPPSSSTASPSPPDSSSASTSDSASASSPATDRPNPPVTGTTGGSLPITGQSLLGLLVAGLTATAIGVFLLILAKRRRA